MLTKRCLLLSSSNSNMLINKLIKATCILIPTTMFISREVCEVYVQEMEKLSYKLLELISLSLGLPANRLNGFFNEDQTSFVRLNHYPPCPIPHLALGVGRHKDAGALTILAQDNVGGLEVKSKADGEWIRVKPTPHAYIINIGDLIQVHLLNLLLYYLF